MTSRGASPRALLLATLLALLGAGVMAAAVRVAGYSALAAPALVVGWLALLARPRFTLALYLVAAIGAQADSMGFLPVTGKVLHPLVSRVTPAELLLITVAVAALIEISRRGELRFPAPFGPALLLFAGAVTAGLVTGHFGGATNGVLIDTARRFGVILLLPFVVVNIVRTREDLHQMIKGAAVLACGLAVFGLAGYALGRGRTINSGVLTFYNPAPNWLMMLFLLVVLATLVARKRPTWLILAATPFVFACLLLSFRRSFWIGAVVGIILVLLVATGGLGWRVSIPAAMALIVAVWLALNVVTESQGPGAGRSTASQSPVLERLQSLNPESLATNAEDRYRIDERANAWDEVRASPLSGLGIGVPWRATHPLPVEHEEGRLYVHFVALYWWLKMGILGLMAYLWLIAAAAYTALRLWRRSADPLLRVCGLGLFGGFVGLGIAETTASFTGVDDQFTILIAAVFGLLASAHAHSADAPPARGPSPDLRPSS